ncbi:uncharacterized protein LOC124367156 isoform X1 [Homalodisca vitripennis]|uniref:uncharacterized protein LOC124367156 isoform X1 n=1 Tax=Homalodisca vitripennis TaxID=197043 RepID=UPI001EEA9CF8|nr:uncharacterized protein LOC124367156 isoform X1 [Homalodisca vitripennis]
MRKYDGCFQTKLITPIKMAVALSLLMLMLVGADTDINSFHSDTMTETTTHWSMTRPPTTMTPPPEVEDDPVNVTARIGSEVFFDCKIPVQGTVVWAYVNPESKIESIEILNWRSRTEHLTLSFKAPNNHRLKIDSVKHADEGYYKCVLSSHRKKVTQVFLKVIEAEN